MAETEVRTTCPYCGVGCGIIAKRAQDGSVSIKGDPDHPANFGRLCSKGSALGETLSLDDRLLYPRVAGVRVTWNAALDHVARQFKTAIAEHGPDSVAFYGSGQMLTEDYYVANKLMKGFVGTANIDTNSRLCMASTVAGHRRAFGADTVPGTYEDLELADLVVLVGSNLAWCHPVLFQRLQAAREKRAIRVVVIDPRRTATCEGADLHLAITPGSDVALFNGLLTNLVAADALDKTFVAEHTQGIRATLAAARGQSFAEIARLTGIPRVQLHEFYDLFTRTERVVTVFSQGVNQSSAGTDKVNAILNCHLATGRIGKPGMGPFSVTGQPNAMGGREVGGLANMLAAHMQLDDPDHRDIVRKVWNAPGLATKPGLKAVDLFRAVGEGRIKALWIMSTNPVDSLPEADVVRRALETCPFVVVSDVIYKTDTTAFADVLLPSLAWGEKSGTVTNSERRISRQRAFLPAPGEARADWWQVREVARRLGHGAAFTFESPSEVFAEHARLSGADNGGTRDFDISGLATLTARQYDDLAPVRWPIPANGKRCERFFADGAFYTPTRRANFVPTPFRGTARAVDGEYPLVLNTGRTRDQWHTMTRTGKAARLMSHAGEPFVELHSHDAARAGIEAAHLAVVESAHGRVIVRAVVTERLRPGQVFVPMHWTDQQASAARIDRLIAGHVDAVSGQPELKAAPVRVTPFAADWYAFAATVDEPSFAKPWSRESDYWAKARSATGWRSELAGGAGGVSAADLLQGLVGLPVDADVVAYLDRSTGQERIAAFAEDRLIGALFLGPTPVAVAREAIAAALGERFVEPAARYRLLAGRTSAAVRDPGPTVCACLGVGRTTILDAVAGGALTISAIGTATGAGTNCGSCRSEIGGLLHATAQHKKAS